MNIIKLKANALREIVAANFVSREPPYQWSENRPFSPPQHFLYFHVEGERAIEYEGNLYNLKPGNMVFFFGRENFHSFIPKTSYRAMNVSFTMSKQDELISGIEDSRMAEENIYMPLVYNAKINSSIYFLFEKIVFSFISSSTLKNLKASFLLSELLIEMAETFEQRAGNIYGSIDTVITLMEQNPGQNWSIDELASKANMSRATLTRRFRKAMDKSIQQFQMDIKLKHAQSIIQNNPEIKVKEVAAMLSFYDEYHFSRTFKRKYNISPLHYKMSLK